MKNLFIAPVIFFTTLIMWLAGSTEASAQDVQILEMPSGSTITINNGDEGLTISADDQILFRNRGNITINGHSISYEREADDSRIVGSSERSTKTVTLDKGFNYIKASRGVDVVMSDKKGDEVTISANSNLIDYVICKSSGGTLTVGIDDKVRSISNFSVVVTIPRRDNVNVYQAASGASINLHHELTCANVSMEASSGGRINCARINCDKLLIGVTSGSNVSGSFRIKQSGIVEASSGADVTISALSPELNLKASSGSTINASGQVKHLDADASSAASIKAFNLNAVTAEAEASSGASIKVNCSKSLEAEASSAADIRYKGECSVERSTSSGGSIKKQ